MRNNKGVTLVELLIVIVVMGIIAAFAVPSVQTIINNTRRSAIYADALAVEQAADLYCADTECATDQTLTWTLLSPYVEGIDEAYYDFTGTPNVAILASGSWTIFLEVDGVNSGEWEFEAGETPSETTRDLSVDADAD